MNIFILSENPKTAAQMMCDRHIPKMVVESAQMLSTVHRMIDGIEEKRQSKSGKRMVKYWKLPDYREDVFYKAVHMSHPCTVWTSVSSENYQWHYEHFVALGEEFEYRYQKTHMTIAKLKDELSVLPKNIKDGQLTPFAQAMNHYPKCKVKGNAVQAYRNYYHAAKPFAKWEKGRIAPDWWQGYTGEAA